MKSCNICEHMVLDELFDEDMQMCIACVDNIWNEHNSNKGYSYLNDDGQVVHTWDYEESIGE